MTVISFVGAVLLVVCTVSISSFGSVKMQRVLDDHSLIPKREVPADFKEIGCYRLNTIKNREGLGTYTSKDISIVMENCNKNAVQKGHHFFGIKRKKGNNKYMCVTGEIKNAKRAKSCNNKIGGRSSVFMYYNKKPDIPSQPCRFGNKSYSEGEHMDRYQPTDNICEACKCSQGKFDCKKKWYCDTDLKACDEYYFPDGSCCPECKLPSCGEKKPGESWYRPGETWPTNSEDCEYCQCQPGDVRLCQEISCLETKCKNPVIPEGKCCPACQAEETTTPTAIIIGPGFPTTSFKYPWEH